MSAMFSTLMKTTAVLEETWLKHCSARVAMVCLPRPTFTPRSLAPRCLASTVRSQQPVATANPMPVPERIYFVTGNKKKLEEVVAIIEAGQELPFHIEGKSADLPELQGEPEDIARQKCRLAAQQLGSAVMVEDTSLCFNAMHGLPGPYIKWFLEKLGHDGLNKMLAGFDDKSAYAQCIFAYTDGPDKEPLVFVGRTPGHVVPARGALDFGWDPIFQPEGYTVTYAEMDKATKNTISHRYRALDKLRSHLLAQCEAHGVS